MSMFPPDIFFSKWAYSDNSRECSCYLFKIKDDAPENVKKEYRLWIETLKASAKNGIKD